MRFLRPRAGVMSRSQLQRRPALALVLAALAPLLLASNVHAENSAIRIGAPLPLTGALSPEGLKLQQGYELWKEVVNAAGGINVGGDKAAGRDRLLRLSVGHAEGRATRREARDRRQGRLHVLTVRLRRHQGGEHGVRTLRHSDRGPDRFLRRGLRPGLQESVRHLHRQQHAVGADDGYRQGQGAQGAARSPSWRATTFFRSRSARSSRNPARSAASRSSISASTRSTRSITPRR